MSERNSKRECSFQKTEKNRIKLLKRIDTHHEREEELRDEE
jgi:hypothetical protein